MLVLTLLSPRPRRTEHPSARYRLPVDHISQRQEEARGEGNDKRRVSEGARRFSTNTGEGGAPGNNCRRRVGGRQVAATRHTLAPCSRQGS